MSADAQPLEHQLYPERGFFLDGRPLRAGDRIEWRSNVLSDGWRDGYFEVFGDVPVVRMAGRELLTTRADAVDLRWPTCANS